MAKRAGRVRFGSGQSGWWVKRVMGQNGSFLNMSIRLRIGLGLPVFFKQIYIYIYIYIFFFEVDDICQLFMSSLTVIRFSLMILLPITTKHLT